MAGIEQAIGKQVSDGISSVLNLQISHVVNQAAAHATGETGRQLAVFAAAMNSSARRSRSNRIRKIHTEVATRAQGAILTAYKGRVRRNPSEPYRENAPGKWRRDSNGAMERGLKSPDFFKATGTTLSFINMGAMDRAARQWYRLNFGAGPAGAATPQPRAFPLRVLQQDTGLALSLAGNPASAPYSMPAGFWAPSGAGAEFVPLGYLKEVGRTVGARNSKRSASKKRMSMGFPGYNYLDAGMDDLAGGLEAGYSILAEEWFKEAAARNKGPVAFVISPGEAGAMVPNIERTIESLMRRGSLGGISRRR